MKEKHLTPHEIDAYLHRTLTDAERESHNRHLAECADCRAVLAQAQAFSAEVKTSLDDTLNIVQPSGGIAFAQVLPRLQINTQTARTLRAHWALSGVSTAAGILLLAAAFLRGSHADTGTALPLLASGLFALPFFSRLAVERKQRVQPKRLFNTALAAALSLGVALLGLYEIFMMQQWILRLVGFWGGNYWLGVTLADFSVLGLACVWIVAIIGNLDYQLTHAGQPRAWKILRLMLLAEALIALLPLMF